MPAAASYVFILPTMMSGIHISIARSHSAMSPADRARAPRQHGLTMRHYGSRRAHFNVGRPDSSWTGPDKALADERADLRDGYDPADADILLCAPVTKLSVEEITVGASPSAITTIDGGVGGPEGSDKPRISRMIVKVHLDPQV
jgi:hypothetical protein